MRWTSPPHGRGDRRTGRQRTDLEAATRPTHGTFPSALRKIGSGVLRDRHSAHPQGSHALRHHVQPHAGQRLCGAFESGPRRPRRKDRATGASASRGFTKPILPAPSSSSSRTKSSTAPSTSPRPIRCPIASSWPALREAWDMPNGLPAPAPLIEIGGILPAHRV